MQDEKAAHKADEEGQKDAAKGGFGQAKDDVKDAAVHAKDAAGKHHYRRSCHYK